MFVVYLFSINFENPKFSCSHTVQLWFTITMEHVALYITHVTRDKDYHVQREQYIEQWSMLILFLLSISNL